MRLGIVRVIKWISLENKLSPYQLNCGNQLIMTLQIHLDPYDQTFTLQGEFIRQKLAGSLFAEALELDPEATEIRIPNSQVTPAALLCLVELSKGKEPTRHVPELAAAGHYLNIDVLLAYADPLYDACGALWDSIEVTLGFVMMYNRVSLLRYLLLRHPNIDYSVYLEKAFVYAARDVAKLLLDTFPVCREMALNAALKCQVYSMLQLVVSYPEIDLLKVEYFSDIIGRGASESLALLLTTLLERGQEAKLRLFKNQSMQISIIARELKYQLYIVHPSHSLLLEIYLQAINRHQFICLAVLNQMIPLMDKDKEIMEQALKKNINFRVEPNGDCACHLNSVSTELGFIQRIPPSTSPRKSSRSGP
jgi:hypothetical protein